MTQNRSEPCAFCAKPAAHRHHLTGRAPSRFYLDPTVTVALCRNHHVLVHEDLRSQHLDTPPRDADHNAALVAFRLGRLGVFLGRFAQYSDEPFWGELAGASRIWANELTAANREAPEPLPGPGRASEDPEDPRDEMRDQ